MIKFIFLFFSVLFCLCGVSEQRKVNVINLLASDNDKITYLSEIATDINYVSLQTLDSSLIGRISSLKVRNDFFYVGTSFEILCFNRAGKYLFKLSNSGRGPGEYELLFGFDINHTASLLAVRSLKSILIYQQTNDHFEFLRKIQLPVTPSDVSFTCGNDNIVIQFDNSNGQNPYLMSLMDINGNYLRTYQNHLGFSLTSGKQVLFEFENTNYCYNGVLLLKNMMNDTLFRFSDKNILEPYVVFDTKGKRITPEARSNGDYLSDHGHEYYRILEIFESEKYIYYTYSYNKIYGHMVYNKINKSKYRIAENTLKDDLMGGDDFRPRYCNNGLFYSWVEALNLKKEVSNSAFSELRVRYPEKKAELKKLADSLTETDNPVLIIVTPKK